MILEKNGFKIELDEDDFLKYKDENFYIYTYNKSRGKVTYIQIYKDRKKFPLGRLILNLTGSIRLGYKDGNPFNLTKNNLYPLTKENIKAKHRAYQNKYQKDAARKARDPEFVKRFFYRYYMLKSAAKKRKIAVTLDKYQYENIVANNLCHYCKATLDGYLGSCLDRIDNEKGYDVDNVLPCCPTCNSIRGDKLTVQETEVAIKAILEYRKRSS